MNELERCCKCDSPTGRAGKGEDSIYIYDYEDEEIGPLCEDCVKGFTFKVIAAKDVVIEAAKIPRDRLIKLDNCTGEVCNECAESCQHYPFCEALDKLKAVQDA